MPFIAPLNLTPERPVRELVAPGAPARRKRGRVMVVSDSDSDSDSDDENVRRIDALIFPEEMDVNEMDIEEEDMPNVNMFRGNYSAQIDDSDSELEVEDEDEEEEDEDVDPDAMDIEEDDATVYLY